MLHYDYHFDITESTLTLDHELDISDIDWEDGDIFQLEVRPNGAIRFTKVGKLEQFVLQNDGK